MMSVHTLLSQSWGPLSRLDSSCLRGNFQGGRCIFPLAAGQQGDLKVLNSHSKTRVLGVAVSCRLLSQWGRTALRSLDIVQDCYLWTGDCSCPGQMEAACAVFRYQSALLEIHTYQQPTAKLTWQLEKWSGGDKEESFGWKQRLTSTREGRKWTFFRSGKIEIQNDKTLKENIYSLSIAP